MSKSRIMCNSAQTIVLILLSLQPVLGQEGRKLQAHYPRMVTRIVEALQPGQGEKAIIRYDPTLMAGLELSLKRELEKKGVAVDAFEYGPVSDFQSRLAKAAIYIWLPAGPGAIQPASQRKALHDWLVEGRGRQIHFHWGDGTRTLDGLNAMHSAAYDSVYLAALDINYIKLDTKQRAAVRKLQASEVRVTTPAGTDLRFKVGGRPFTRQNGDASKAAASAAEAIIGREIELPAGAVRVAPLEESVNGLIVLPSARFTSTEVKQLRMEFEKGKIVRFSAAEGEAAFRAALARSPALYHFRELGLGFNPGLRTPKNQSAIPYYGYGAGIVRLSLGNNEELGGAVSGEGVRWLLFDDATIKVDGSVVLLDGELQL